MVAIWSSASILTSDAGAKLRPALLARQTPCELSIPGVDGPNRFTSGYVTGLQRVGQVRYKLVNNVRSKPCGPRPDFS